VLSAERVIWRLHLQQRKYVALPVARVPLCQFTYLGIRSKRQRFDTRFRTCRPRHTLWRELRVGSNGIDGHVI
jgi:hypothetical protein